MEISASAFKGRASALVVGVAMMALCLPVSAQQKFKYSFGTSAQTKYSEQHTLDVGDVPGHQIRVATLSTKYGSEAPTYDGVKAVESTGWLSSDYIAGNGRFIQYVATQMENGDKIYSFV